jgi:hypothetical protein
MARLALALLCLAGLCLAGSAHPTSEPRGSAGGAACRCSPACRPSANHQPRPRAVPTHHHHRKLAQNATAPNATAPTGGGGGAGASACGPPPRCRLGLLAGSALTSAPCGMP